MDACQLIDDLNSADVEIRRHAAERLSRHADVKAAAVSLVRCCSDPDEVVREWSTAALEEMGEPSPADGVALAELLQTSDAGGARYWAVTLLGRLGAEAAFAVPDLVHVLTDDPASATRERAAWALGKIGSSAQSGLDALRQAARDGTPRLKRLAEQAIRQISGA